MLSNALRQLWHGFNRPFMVMFETTLHCNMKCGYCAIWQNQQPFEYRGKYWSVNKTETMYSLLHYFLTPYQKPHPPIGVAAASYKSPTLTIAGEQGFIPMSLALNTDYVNSQWEAVTEGAQKTGRTVSRSAWRLVRDVYIAETDEEKRRMRAAEQRRAARLARPLAP